MLTYNTHLKELRLPEYGRNIQKMVDYCLTLESREERTNCAYAIVLAMSVLFPDQKSDDQQNRKFWDHLAVMSDFKLDIDWPVPVIQPDSIAETPDPLPYDQGMVQRRWYGGNIERMIDAAADMDDSDDRMALIALVASQMKKNLLASGVSDDVDNRVYRDLYDISRGRIRVNADVVPLAEFNVVAPAKKKKKK